MRILEPDSQYFLCVNSRELWYRYRNSVVGSVVELNGMYPFRDSLSYFIQHRCYYFNDFSSYGN